MNQGNAEEQLGAGWARESLADGEELLILNGQACVNKVQRATILAQQVCGGLIPRRRYHSKDTSGFKIESATYRLLIKPLCLPAHPVYEPPMQDLKMHRRPSERL